MEWLESDHDVDRRRPGRRRIPKARTPSEAFEAEVLRGFDLNLRSILRKSPFRKLVGPSRKRKGKGVLKAERRARSTARHFMNTFRKGLAENRPRASLN